MNKNELVASVADASGLSKVDAAKAVDGVFESITNALKSGGDVRIVSSIDEVISNALVDSPQELSMLEPSKIAKNESSNSNKTSISH